MLQGKTPFYSNVTPT